MLYFQTLSKVTRCHFTGKRNWSQRTWPAQKKHPAGQEQTQPRPCSYFRSASQWSLVSWTSCKTAQHQHPHCSVLRSFFFYHLAKQQIHFFWNAKTLCEVCVHPFCAPLQPLGAHESKILNKGAATGALLCPWNWALSAAAADQTMTQCKRIFHIYPLWKKQAEQLVLVSIKIKPNALCFLDSQSRDSQWLM